MRIINMNTDSIVPYKNNTRNNDEAVEYVANSIKEFGFKVPIVIDKNNVIVTGHTRWKASKKLGLKKVPCIRADDLTEEQIKAFRVADNSVAEVATWDIGKLEMELEDISFDMGEFAVDLDEFDDESVSRERIDDGFFGDERQRTNDAYNLDLIDHENLTNDFWQMPVIENQNHIPNDMIGFNYAMSSDKIESGIHFYVDDYQFERVWNSPEKYVDILSEYDCIITPDFSLYMDMPMPMKIWNVYRSRFIGAYYQSKGITVIPTVSWAEEETFEFCFQGIPEGSIVSVSTIGVKENKEALDVWYAGMAAMIDYIKPSVILVYGGKLDYDYGDILVKYFDNKVTERMKLSKEKQEE